MTREDAYGFRTLYRTVWFRQRPFPVRREAEWLAILEADRLGQRRTGAASGTATRLLSRPDAGTMTLFGAGGQAESQLEAGAAIRPLSRVSVCSRTKKRRGEFRRRMNERLGIRMEGADDAEEAARQSHGLALWDVAVAVCIYNVKRAGGSSVAPSTGVAPTPGS